MLSFFSEPHVFFSESEIDVFEAVDQKRREEEMVLIKYTLVN